MLRSVRADDRFCRDQSKGFSIGSAGKQSDAGGMKCLKISTITALKPPIIQLVKLFCRLGLAEAGVVEGLPHRFHHDMRIHGAQSIDVDDAARAITPLARRHLTHLV